MKITPLRYTFIGNWAFTPTVIEIKDNAFCKSIFNKPSITNSGNSNLTTNGIGLDTFIITSQPQLGLGSNDFVTINKQQLQIISSNINLISEVIQKLQIKLTELNTQQFKFSFISNSLSIDNEIEGFYDTNATSSKWLSEKFIEKNMSLVDEFKHYDIHVADITLVIQKQDNLRVIIQIQPRANNNKQLFIKITEEFSFLNDNEITKEITNKLASLSQTNEVQINKILNERH